MTTEQNITKASIATRTLKDLLLKDRESVFEGHLTAQLLHVYNANTGKSISRFSSRANGVVRVRKVLLAQLDAEAKKLPSAGKTVTHKEASAEKVTAKTEAKKLPSAGKVIAKNSSDPAPECFNLVPSDEVLAPRKPREDTKRRMVFDLISKPEGALFSEIQKKTGWSRKDTYEGTRLICNSNGYAIRAEADKDGTRIYLV